MKTVKVVAAGSVSVACIIGFFVDSSNWLRVVVVFLALFGAFLLLANLAEGFLIGFVQGVRGEYKEDDK